MLIQLSIHLLYTYIKIYSKANTKKATQRNILKNSIDKSKWDSKIYSHNPQEVRGKTQRN